MSGVRHRTIAVWAAMRRHLFRIAGRKARSKARSGRLPWHTLKTYYETGPVPGEGFVKIWKFWPVLVLSVGLMQANEVRAEQGLELFVDHCAGCHGVGGDGRGKAAGIFAVSPPSFLGKSSSIRFKTDEELEAVVALGGAARGMSPVMPAFGEVLSAPQISAVVDWVRTLYLRSERGKRPSRPDTMRFSSGKSFFPDPSPVQKPVVPVPRVQVPQTEVPRVSPAPSPFR